jgi:hypothetical protein
MYYFVLQSLRPSVGCFAGRARRTVVPKKHCRECGLSRCGRLFIADAEKRTQPLEAASLSKTHSARVELVLFPIADPSRVAGNSKGRQSALSAITTAPFPRPIGREGDRLLARACQPSIVLGLRFLTESPADAGKPLVDILQR